MNSDLRTFRPASPQSESAGTRAEDALTLVRLAGRNRGVAGVLDWLAGRTGGTVAVVAGDATVLAAAPHHPGPELRDAVAALHRRRMPSGVTGGSGENTVHVVALGDGGPYLALEHTGSHRHGTLLADTAHILRLCWRLEESERERRRMASVDAHSREAVLHLVMIGSVAAAHRVAGALGSGLPNPVRIYLIEVPETRRPVIARRLARLADGRAWIVPCPVRDNHLVALVPAGADLWEHEIVDEVPECCVGVGDEVVLQEAAHGYEQAFHALAVARSAPTRRARFGRHIGLSPLLGPEGAGWAARLLEPCLTYEPSRRTGPGPEELLATLGSWLSFGTLSCVHLKIHRNTLAARLRLVEGLLGMEITRSLADQSAAWLALRLHARHPAFTGSAESLDALLAVPAARTWAQAQIAPLDSATGTVCAWLRADARLPATAAGLGISLPGARKRLTRAEEKLERSLLHAPSAKYELWLAAKALGML